MLVRISVKKHIIMAFILVAFGFSGCSLERETALVEKRVEIKHDAVSDQYMTASLSGDVIRSIANHYARYGDGDVDITITYDPHSRSNTAYKAERKAGDFAESLNMYGVDGVNTEILPVNNAGDSVTIINYDIVTAHAPSGCSNLVSMPDDNEAYRDYGFRCTTETYLARQLSKPSDLLGNDGSAYPDGRRQSNIVTSYKTGIAAKPLEGLSALE